MYKNKHKIKYEKERALLGDTLPVEVPLIFSNNFFYEYLKKRNNNGIIDEPDYIKSLLTSKNYTIPYEFKISKDDKSYRSLSIIHPKDQIKLCNFYDEYKYLIIYYCQISKFSIRSPYKVSKSEYHNDEIHKLKYKFNEKGVIETYDKEYKSSSTFFVYKNYSNIGLFYEDHKFHKAEKKYQKMGKLDISKCFDSIYTHSIAWALIEKKFIKKNYSNSEKSKSFGEVFDTLMQKNNYNETNGIVIGPEFSRIFAELILQQIDKNILTTLKEKEIIYKRDYEIFRYVDDYFIFYNSEITFNIIEEEIKNRLLEYKFHINSSKSITYNKPIITNETIAKNKIKKLFTDIPFYEFKNNDEKDQITFKSKINTSYIITLYKSILKESNVSYADVMGYTLSIIENNLKDCLKYYSKIDEDMHDENNKTIFVKYIINIVELIFFIYSVTPRVNFTIKVSSILINVIDIFKNKKIKEQNNVLIVLDYTHEDLIKKTIFDEINTILDRNVYIENKEIETIYLINILTELGHNYLISETKLYRYFKLGKNILGYFTIINLLYYISNKQRYKNIKSTLLNSIQDKLNKFSTEELKQNSETVLLLFDLLSCHYLEEGYKKKILSIYGIDKDKIGFIKFVNENKIYFTRWKGFNFNKEMKRKKKLEVY